MKQLQKYLFNNGKNRVETIEIASWDDKIECARQGKEVIQFAKLAYECNATAIHPFNKHPPLKSITCESHAVSVFSLLLRAIQRRSYAYRMRQFLFSENSFYKLNGFFKGLSWEILNLLSVNHFHIRSSYRMNHTLQNIFLVKRSQVVTYSIWKNIKCALYHR